MVNQLEATQVETVGLRKVAQAEGCGEKTHQVPALSPRMFGGEGGSGSSKTGDKLDVAP